MVTIAIAVVVGLVLFALVTMIVPGTIGILLGVLVFLVCVAVGFGGVPRAGGRL